MRINTNVAGIITEHEMLKHGGMNFEIQTRQEVRMCSTSPEKKE